MTTFSQLIDRVAKDLVRPDMTDLMLPAYLNQTIREMFVNAQTNLPVFFDDTRKEELIQVSQVNTETGAFVWPLPTATLLQRIEAVYYGRTRRYVQMGSPKSSLVTNFSAVNGDCFWYRVGTNLVFAGAGDDGDNIRISYFEYPRGLTYYPDGSRPAYWDDENQQYMVQAGQTPELALAKTTNFLLERHEQVLAEGLRAKAYKRMDDAARARMCYSQFESMRIGVQNTESLNFDVIFNK